jgi:hypothetical protein
LDFSIPTLFQFVAPTETVDIGSRESVFAEIRETAVLVPPPSTPMKRDITGFEYAQRQQAL